MRVVFQAAGRARKERGRRTACGSAGNLLNVLPDVVVVVGLVVVGADGEFGRP